MAVGSCGTPGIEHVELRHSALYPCAALEHERRPDACTARAASSWHTTGCTPFASTAFLVKLFLQAHPTLVAYSAGRRRRGSRANWASLSQGEAGRQQQQCQHAGGGGPAPDRAWQPDTVGATTRAPREQVLSGCTVAAASRSVGVLHQSRGPRRLGLHEDEYDV